MTPFFSLRGVMSALCCWWCVKGYRMGEVDNTGSTEAYVFSHASGSFWSKGELAARLHGARLVDISNRGVRVISVGTPITNKMTPQACIPCPNALCCTEDGPVFPQTPGPFAVHVERQSTLSRCGHTSSPRRAYQSNRSQYTVLACDVLQGDAVVIYDVASAHLWWGKNTYGPLSYVLALGCMLSCLIGMSTSSVHPMHVAVACSGAAGTALIVAVQSLFVTVEDLCMLGVPLVLHGVCVLVWATQSAKREESAQLAYFYSMCVLTTASYRTAENPYAAVLCLYLLVKLTRHVLSVGGGKLKAKEEEGGLLASCAAFYLGMLMEYGLIPQFSQEASWPLYMGSVCLVVMVACTAWLQL